MDILLTTFLTVFSGVVVYAMSQIVIKFFIEPLHEHKKLIGRIADALIFYNNVYSNPGVSPAVVNNEASKELRELAAYLISKTHLIPCNTFLSYLHIVPKKEQIMEAYKNLIGLSNSVFRGDPLKNARMREKIEGALGIQLDLGSQRSRKLLRKLKKAK